jgi:hypothetical protein
MVALRAASASTNPPFRRVRPADPGWPPVERWEQLNRQVGGRVIKVRSPLDDCANAGSCASLFRTLRNPYYINSEPGLTQTLGWEGAWLSRPSAYGVVAATAADVAAAVNFARENNLRLQLSGRVECP